MKEIEKSEDEILNRVTEIWNTFTKIEQTHPSDINDFAEAVHAIQKIIAIRIVRRLDDSRFVTIDSK